MSNFQSKSASYQLIRFQWKEQMDLLFLKWLKSFLQTVRKSTSSIFLYENFNDQSLRFSIPWKISPHTTSIYRLLIWFISLVVVVVVAEVKTLIVVSKIEGRI